MTGTPTPQKLSAPSLSEAFKFWLKLGFISFGGPAGQISIMQNELVEKRKWISQDRFLHALNYCMLLPGPEATQLAIYIGWLLHKTLGGLMAGSLFVIPSAIILWVLSFLYVSYGSVLWIAAIFYGLKPAVVAIVVAALLRIGGKVLKNAAMVLVAGFAFVSICFFKLPYPLIIVIAALIGLLGSKFWPDKFLVIDLKESEDSTDIAVINDSDSSPAHTAISHMRSLKVLFVGILLWLGPTLLLGIMFGYKYALFQEGLFFSKAALVTFGGAYAVLPYVSQQAVENFHWLSSGQMLDGLGLAETTPGPLIIVLQFVGFLGGWNNAASSSPLLAATLGAFVSSWATFAPSFLWIFLGGPYIEQLRGNKKLASSLSSVTAAVVGVILNLAVWFALKVFSPFDGQVDWVAILLFLLALAGIQRFKVGVIPVVLGSGLLGILVKTFL